jgi:hypothetical protein
MKSFYSIEPRHNLRHSSVKYEQVEYDINTLIREEAEMCVNDDLSDDEWETAVEEKAQEIKEELMRNGIWRNEFGHPVFMYC